MSMDMTSLLRALWEDPWEGQNRPSRLYDQRFGNVITDDPALLPLIFSGRGLRSPPHQTGLSEVVNGDKEFRVNLNVEDFRPEELKVKVKDRRVIISAVHEERQDQHGFISREFTRHYFLPKDVEPDGLTSSLKDGVLIIRAPKVALEAPIERIIIITFEKGDDKPILTDKGDKPTSSTDKGDQPTDKGDKSIASDKEEAVAKS